MPLPSTMTPIATNTLTTATNTVTFSSIPQIYTDLVFIINGTNTLSSTNYYQINGDTGTNYSQTNLTGNGTSAASSRRTTNDSIIFSDPLGASTNQFHYILNILNYANSTTYKTTLHRDGSAAAYTTTNVGLWRSTAAVSSISIKGTNNFAVGSTFTLYGIKAA